MPADIILRNANVITLDPARPRASLVATEDVTIMAVGDEPDLDSLSSPRTRVIDCEGRTLVPGFNDAHFHLFSLLLDLVSIDVSPAAVRSVEDIKRAVRERAAATPRGTPLHGAGYNEFYLEGRRCPTRADLDEAVPDHPVILSHRSLHACVLNSKALELAGIGPETPEPPGGRIERDLATGEPNGILYNMLGPVRNRVLPPLDGETLKEGLRRADTFFLSHGITSVQEATATNGTDRWEKMCSFILNRDLRSRLTMMAGSPHWRDFRDCGLTTRSGDDLMQLGAVKVMLGVNDAGVDPPQDELNETAYEIHRAGYQLAFHAVAESTVRAVAGALEYIAARDRPNGRRHRVEHCGECPPDLLERLRQLGAVIVTQPPYIYYNGERYLATVPASQQPYLYAMRSALRKGIMLAASSDAPVVPNDPLVGLYAAVTRRTATGEEVVPEEAVPPETALRLYTLNAAHASFEEPRKGSLVRGKLADMALLSADPTTVDPEEIKDIKVDLTMMGGQVVWER
jgi:predicted amidohydrolase YtcJ